MRTGVLIPALLAGLTGTALADDDVNPKTDWKPVLESRAAAELSTEIVSADASNLEDPETMNGVPLASADPSTPELGTGFDLAARVGAEVHRRALTARITLAADTRWSMGSIDGDAEYTDSATIPYLSEMWVDLNPKISESLETSVRVGRQPIQFHDGRLVGRNDLTLRADDLDVVKILLRGDPFQIELAGGADLDPADFGNLTATELGTEPRITLRASATPLILARAGFSRESPVSQWVADAVFITADVPEGARENTAAGVYAKADVARVRARFDAYIEPYPLAPAWLAGARFGWAFGDDARVVLGLLCDARSAEGGGTLAFVRPWHTAGEDFGQLELYEPDARYGQDGVVDAGIYTESKVVPSLRINGEAHLFSALESSETQQETNVDIHWYFTPHTQLRLRSAVNIPLSDATQLRSLTAISLDLAI